MDDPVEMAIAGVEGLGVKLDQLAASVGAIVTGPLTAASAALGIVATAGATLTASLAGLATGPVAALTATLNVSVVAPFNALATAVTGMVAGPLAAASQQIGALTAGFTALAGGMETFRNAVVALPQAMTPFISALSPGLMNAFNYALGTLNATIGSALAPAFAVLTSLIHSVAGEIAPVMQQLAPIFAQLAQTVAAVVVPVVQVMASELTALMPLFQFLADVLRNMVPVFQAWGVVVQSLIRVIGDWLASLFGGDAFKSGMDRFKHAIEEIATQMILLSARLAMLFTGSHVDPKTKQLVQDASPFVEKLKQTIEASPPQHLGWIQWAEENAKQGVAPAPTGASTQSLESMLSQVSSMAFLAGGAEMPKSEESQWLQKCYEELKNLKQDNLLTILQAWWEWVLSSGVHAGEAFWGAVGNTGAGQTFKAIFDAVEMARRGFKGGV